MKQADLKDWCELKEHDCYVYETRIKEDGTYYLMRNNKDRNLMAMIFPTKGDRAYKPASVCHICNQLDIPVPEYGQSMQEDVKKAKEGCPKDWKTDKDRP